MAEIRGGLTADQGALNLYDESLATADAAGAGSRAGNVDASQVVAGTTPQDLLESDAAYQAQGFTDQGIGGALPTGATTNPHPEYTPEWYDYELQHGEVGSQAINLGLISLIGGGVLGLGEGAAGIGAGGISDLDAAGAAAGGGSLAEGGAELAGLPFAGGAAGSGALAGAAAGGADLADAAAASPDLLEGGAAATPDLFGGGAAGGGAVASDAAPSALTGGAVPDLSAAGGASGGATLSDGSAALETPSITPGATPDAISSDAVPGLTPDFTGGTPSLDVSGGATPSGVSGGLGGPGGDTLTGVGGGAGAPGGDATDMSTWTDDQVADAQKAFAANNPSGGIWDSIKSGASKLGLTNANNPLGIGKNAVSLVGSAYNAYKQKQATSSLQKQEQAAAQPITDASKSLIAQGESGQVPAAIMQEFQTTRDQTVAAIKQRYANMGRDPNNDSAAAAEIANANNAMNAGVANYSQQILTEGLDAAGIATNAGIEAAKAGAASDDAYQKALMSFLTSQATSAAFK